MMVTVMGVGLFAPGLAGWNAENRACLAGARPYQSAALPVFAPLALPRNEARRVSFSIRLALQVAQEACIDAGWNPADCASVFACSGGDTEALDKIQSALLLPDKPVSPNQFTHSVHNAPAGYWAIVAGSRQSTISLSAFDASFAAGLLEAASFSAVQRQPVLLVAHDTPPPPPLQRFRRVTEPFAVALALSPAQTGHERERLTLALTDAGGTETLADPGLEQLRLANPAARGLSLLRLLAARRRGRVILPYFEPAGLRVDYAPC
ncbi:MAG: beta-ketoacyl synthase chain length factor [Gammaproteobacteria bacterium]